MRLRCISIVLSLGSAGCVGFLRVGDGYLRVQGHVYESRGALSGNSSVVVDAKPSAEPGGDVPLAGCSVVLEPWSPAKRPKPDTAEVWISRGTSGTAGEFSVGGTAAPGRYSATISVACDGFEPVQHVFLHDRFRHDAVVTMARRGSDPNRGAAER
jgi:hypothetical protein